MAILTNRSDVIANFVRYHGRQPNAGELAPGGVIEYLTTKAPTQVEQLLAKDSPITKGDIWSVYQQKQTARATTGSTSATPPATTAPKETLDAIGTMLKEKYPGLTDTEFNFLTDTFAKKDTFIGKTAPTDAEIAQMVSDEATNAASDLNPYYQRISGEELADFKKQMSDIRAKSETFKANEENTYQKTLANTKQTLRAKGLTFSGTSLKNIGSESALRNPTGIEGSLQTGRRLDYEDALQGYQQDASKLATEAERRLGTAPVAGALSEVGGLAVPTDLSRLAAPIATTSGGYGGTGSMASTIDQERAKAIEESTQQRMTQRRLSFS
jgi:hypothetical protein